MTLKCTIGKNNREYYFRNGKRISKNDLGDEKVQCFRADQAKGRKKGLLKKKGRYCTIGKNGRKYYFLNGLRIKNSEAKKHNVKCLKTPKSKKKPKKKSTKKPKKKSTKKSKKKTEPFRVMPPLFVEIKENITPKEIKQSPEIHRHLLQIVCADLPRIQKAKKLGSGTEGTVYQHCFITRNGREICSFAAKVQNCTSREYKKLLKEQKLNNRAAQINLAPTIYKTIKCRNRCVILMDLVSGETLTQLIDSGKLTRNIFDKFLYAVKKLHHILPNGHGDFNPQNIFYSNGRFVFIDFGTPKKTRSSQEDYGTLLYYLPWYCPNLSPNLCRYIYDQVIKNLTTGPVVSLVSAGKIDVVRKLYESNPLNDFLKDILQNYANGHFFHFDE